MQHRISRGSSGLFVFFPGPANDNKNQEPDFRNSGSFKPPVHLIAQGYLFRSFLICVAGINHPQKSRNNKHDSRSECSLCKKHSLHYLISMLPATTRSEYHDYCAFKEKDAGAEKSKVICPKVTKLSGRARIQTYICLAVKLKLLPTTSLAPRNCSDGESFCNTRKSQRGIQTGELLG